MKHYFRFACALTLALAVASPVAAADPPRAPAGKWVVDFAEHQCLATRDYGTPGKPLLLALKPTPTGEMMQIALVIKSSGSRDPRDAPVTIRIDDGAPVVSRLLAFDPKQDGFRLIRINLPLADFAPMRAARRVAIASGGLIDESFALGQMPALMTAMDRCLASLQTYWNIDAAAAAGLKQRAKGNLARYVNSDDYPGIAAFKGDTGRVAFVLLIDEAGKVADCMVTATSNVPALDAQSCAVLMTKAKLEPAIGADGKPAKDALRAAIRWVLPRS